MNAELKIAPEARRQPRPASAVGTAVGMIGLVGLFAWAAIAWGWGMAGPFAALTALLACGIPMVLWSLLVDKVHRNPSTGIDWENPPRPLAQTWDISLTKIAGLWVIWAVIAAVYCIARWYWSGPYLFAMQVLGLAAIPLMTLSVPYVIWIDRRLKEPRDGAWHFGQLIVGKIHLVDRELLYDFLRSWAVKGFYLAFMLSIVPGNWWLMMSAAPADVFASPVSFSHWLIAGMFMIDVSFATVGYVLTLKPLDSHIRSANPYMAGWVAALICYPPFILMNTGGPLDYRVGTMGENSWVHWLDGWTVASGVMGFILVILTGIYAWATVAFGFRFSNLTNRGILTNGPYAWTKHPAYVSKNIFWWLAILPFFVTTGSFTDMVRNTAVMALVSGVYYWRARTEEKHLMADPAYRDYAAWMDRHGPLPRLINYLVRTARPDPLPAE